MPTIQTHSQKFFGQALDDVQVVLRENKPGMQKIYGGLCHKFPIMVLTCGLCQAVAFVEAKAVGKDPDRVHAYKLLREHVAALLGVTPSTLQDTVRDAPLGEYMRFTRRIRQAWVYYKRFAVSILKVEAGDDIDQEAP